MKNIEFINIADLPDPEGRSYREVNNSKRHKYNVMSLVELDDGTRLYIVKQTRDCDGTPLYSLGLRDYTGVIHGIDEDSIKLI